MGCVDATGKPNFASGTRDSASPAEWGPNEAGDYSPYAGEVDGGSPGGAAGSCTFTIPGRVALSSVRLSSVAIYGHVFAGEDPVHYPQDAAVTITRTESPCGGTSATSNGGGPNCGTTSSGCTEGDVKWWQSSANGALFNCYDSVCGGENPESCSGAYGGTLTYSNTEWFCSDMGPLSAIFNGTQYDNPDTIATTSGGCVAGSAHFELVPLHLSDFDHDGLFGGSLLAIQTSGSATLTRNAWITGITLTAAPSGGTLRVLTGDDPYQFTAHDALLNASAISSVVSGTTSFATGSLRGNSPFVSSELGVSDLNSYEADITWTCGSGATGVTRPTGYTFRLSDIGCPAVQKMTLRVASTPPRVTLEQYGYLGTWFTTFTAPTADGQGFLFHEGDLVIDGAVVSTNSQQAVVKLKGVLYDGVPVCTAGTYTFAREQ